MQAQGSDCTHVSDCGLDHAPDAEIVRHAAAQNAIIVSKDSDFFWQANQGDSVVRLVWVRLGNCRNLQLLAVFERILPRLLGELQEGARIVEVRSSND